jgi:LuxR family maltose regulon positive regulatory protein
MASEPRWGVAVPLIVAKRAVPPARPNAIARQRLSERLLGNGDSRLSVVVAPPGWGKSTLLSQWANDPRESRPIAWVSLDDSDDEPSRFWTYVISALYAAGGRAGREALAVMSAASANAIDAALATLLNELNNSETQHVLVLDDFHALSDARILEGIEFVLTYAPPFLHVVLAARFDPPLPLARYRARGELTEIRAGNLQFDHAEAMRLFANLSGVAPDPETTRELVDRTEGWAVGLQLAALKLRAAADPHASAVAVRGDDRHVLDYFATEVLPALNDEQRELLMRTSMFATICGPLCDAVLDTTGSRAVLEQLDRDDLFVVPLDPQHEWYRCHRLFRDALRWHLESTDPGSIPDLLRRAAVWFDANGEHEEAVRAFLEAGDDPRAVDLLGASFTWFVEHGRALTFLRLGEAASETAAGQPRVCLALAWAAGAVGRPDLVEKWLDVVDGFVLAGAPPMPGWQTLEAHALAMRSTSAIASDADWQRSLPLARRAVELEQDPRTEGYVITRVALASTLMVADRHAEASVILTEVWALPARRQLPIFLVLQVAGLLAASSLRIDDVAVARRVCADVQPLAAALEAERGDGGAASLALLRLSEGRIAYRDGDIEPARACLRRAVELAAVWGRPTNLVSALTSLADVELAAGDVAAARRALDEAREVRDADAIAPGVAADLERTVARLTRGSERTARRSGALAEDLTERERSILRHLPGGASQREIAGELYLSLNTVKGYTKSLYRKLDVGTRQDAVERGRALGLI